MTQGQQRIKIAEACGWRVWKHLPTPETGEMMPAMMPPKHLHDQGEPMRFADELPDYLNDLNAMNEAEKSLPDLHLYRKFLYLVVLDDTTNTANEPAFATAKQRAEAFLRTLGIWQDDAGTKDHP